MIGSSSTKDQSSLLSPQELYMGACNFVMRIEWELLASGIGLGLSLLHFLDLDDGITFMT